MDTPKQPCKAWLSVLLFVASLGPNAMASSIFTGVTVGAIWRTPDTATTYSDAGTAVVGSSVEFPIFPGNTAATIDFSDTANIITINWADNGTPSIPYDSATFNGFELSILSTAPPLSSVVILSTAGTWTSFGSERLSFDATHIFVNMQSLSNQPSGQIVLGYNTGVVPEPGTFGMMGAALASLLLRSRNSRQFLIRRTGKRQGSSRDSANGA